MLECGAGRWQSAEDFARAGLEPVESTAEDILALAVEMNERLDGTYRTIRVAVSAPERISVGTRT